MASSAAVDVHGTVIPGFEQVRDAFAANFARGEEIGACFAATVDGSLVVDIWAGCRDAGQTLPWEENTTVNVFSTTKAMVATAAAMLADRGLLEYGKPVAYNWPEFAQNGKAEITVAQLTPPLENFGERSIPQATVVLLTQPRNAVRTRPSHRRVGGDTSQASLMQGPANRGHSGPPSSAGSCPCNSAACWIGSKPSQPVGCRRFARLLDAE